MIFQISRAMQLSITQTAKHHGHVLLNINGLSLVKMLMAMIYQKRSSAENILPNGNLVMNHIIQSTTKKNSSLYAKYKELASTEPNIIFGGRLGEYKYYDMDQTVATVLDRCEKELN